MSDINVTSLTTCEVGPDGANVRLNMRDAAGGCVSLVLPSATLKSLIMTLPNLERLALQSRHRDSSLRLVYPVGAITIERAADTTSLIVTLSTPDGFQMSFELSRGQVDLLADTGESESINGATLQ